MDSLPTELLLRILQLAAPLDFDPDTHDERYTLLRSFCLVSSKWCALAQPMLPEVLEFQGGADWEALKDDSNSLMGSRIKTAVLYEDEGNDVARLVALTPNIDDIRSVDAISFDISAVLDLKGSFVMPFFANNLLTKSSAALCRLTVEGARFPLELASSPLPSLVELSLDGAQVNTQSLSCWLNGRQLPSLRALAVVLVGEPSAAEPFPTLSLLFLSQLEAVSVLGHLPSAYNTSEYQQLARRRILSDVPLNSSYPLLSLKPRHLSHFPRAIRMFITSDVDEVNPDSGAASLDALNCLAEHLATLRRKLKKLPLPSPLQYLLLPRFLDPKENQLHEIRSAIADIVAVCAVKEIEVEFEALSRWSLMSKVSPEFWRRSRRLEREEEAV